MVARGGDDYELIGGGDPNEPGFTSYANRDNYEYGGYAGGADDARKKMYGGYQSALQRGGPQANYSQADGDLARAMMLRGNQDAQLDTVDAQMYGGMTPQQAQLQAGTQSAIGAQQSLANSGRGFGAISMAGRLGDQRGAQLQMQGNQQMAMQQAQDMAAARDMYAGLSNQIYGQDLATRGALNQRAMGDAALADQQQARNDEMARYYLNERYRIGQGQLGASMGYEAQDAANRLGYSNLAAQQAERAAARQEATENAAIRGGAEGTSFLASQMGKASKEPGGYDYSGAGNYSNGIFHKNPY